MFNELDASGYNYKGIIYNTEFESILCKIIICYQLMVEDNVILDNDENSIRDILLLNYLKNNNIRKKIDLTNFLFDREVPEDTTIGRTDIKIQTLNTFVDTSAYYIIECKRINSINVNGTTGLNAMYIQNGIYRFTSNLYSNHYNTNGMIGFVVDNLDIHNNIISLNSLLKNESFKSANTSKEITIRTILSGFDFSYCSTHTKDKSIIIIYHLMFDFSRNIRP